MDKHDFTIKVDWPVTGTGAGTGWVSTSAEVQQIAAITRYKLIRNTPPDPFEYTLFFTNTEHYDYYFTDKTDEHYENNTYINRDHFIGYNSDDPTIVSITGV